MPEAYSRAAAFLQPRIDGVVAELVELLREQLPAYAAEDVDPLRRNIRTTLEIGLTELRLGRTPDTVDLEPIAAHARVWAAEGRPLDQRTFQLGTRLVMAVVAEHAEELGIDDAALFTMQDALWEWATMCADVLVEAERDFEVAAARRDAARRADFLRDLSSGRITAERLAHEAELHGLSLDSPYFAVRVACPDPAVAGALEAHIRQSGATGERRGLHVVVGGRLLAVTPRIPDEYEGVAIAVGPATVLRDAHSSFSEAAEALTVALAFGVTGVVDLPDLGPLPLVTEADTLAERLAERHLGELDARGQAGLALTRTVTALLDLNRNVEATATALNLHRNSIRYRVDRFCELTGLDLRRTEDLVTAWWLLKRRQAEGARETVPL